MRGQNKGHALTDQPTNQPIHLSPSTRLFALSFTTSTGSNQNLISAPAKEGILMPMAFIASRLPHLSQVLLIISRLNGLFYQLCARVSVSVRVSVCGFFCVCVRITTILLTVESEMLLKNRV